jgi:hypothetical protein
MIGVDWIAGLPTACTLPDRRSTWFWIMSKPAAVYGDGG